ncbi:PIN domain-containing protein [Modestobacter sp. DSM 44400]|uniref:type II toxin-antitoxin system VapC family toxin n=1 Tax=Modestobacter sp. DSM 44400 TaxID=1550230 RepID=UPI00089BB0D5|nr:type II toxin-antitoxin system VapC family toxin [Modestobacter sp. DSM 44400]SDX71998.1 PIN domain-containing protein [Modestobacter sp. DSM 44400]
MIQLDSSALAKLVLAEPESDALEAWLSARTELTVVASDLVRVEVVRAVARLEPGAVPTARALLAGLYLVPVTTDLLELAAGAGPSSLRSLDAIHLATATILGPELEAFVVYDHRLAGAAVDAGLPVTRPS